MKLLVTGANGFLGRAIVASALARGHAVRALLRPGRTVDGLPWQGHENVEVAHAELSQDAALNDALRGVDAVIHTAAAMTGDYDSQYAGTIDTTRALLAAMQNGAVMRLVGVSSFSVYDYDRPAAGAVLDSNAPLEADPSRRDDYTRIKLLQEQLFRDFAQAGGQVTILRPGLIYGRNQLWGFFLGQALGPDRWLRLGPDSDELPLTYVENCGDALVLAATQARAVGETLNIVDDDRRGRQAFIAALNRHPALRKSVLGFPWRLHRLLAALASFVNDRLVGGRLPLPGLLRTRALNARFKALRYSNDRAKQVLGWRPAYDVDQAIQRSLQDEPEPAGPRHG
jgi:nucleoside-diphosphate-sugar epimerase